jgi:hypothetical protein
VTPEQFEIGRAVVGHIHEKNRRGHHGPDPMRAVVVVRRRP